MSLIPPAPPATAGVVIDDTALVALGAGNQLMSRLVVAAHNDAGRIVLAPAMCLAAAVSTRPRLSDHVGGLLAIAVIDLTFSAAGTAGALIAQGAPWQRAHAIAAATPSAEWPHGLPVVTDDPDTYRALGLRVIPIS